MSNDNDLIYFDGVWYLSRNPDVANSGMDPRLHYDTYGKNEGRAPNATAESILIDDEFDSIWYRNKYREIIEKGTSPAEHYLTIGRATNKFPNPLSLEKSFLLEVFDPIWYLARNKDVAQSGMDPTRHFLNYGHEEGRSPNERLESRAKWRRWFDPLWYAARYPDIVQSGLPPLEHFLRIGIYEGRTPHSAAEDTNDWTPIVDPAWYTSRYSDVSSSGLNPVEHFVRYGIITHRRPSAEAQERKVPVERASVEIIEYESLSQDVVLFVTFTPTRHLRPHIVHHLKAFKKAEISIIMIVATDSPTIEITEEIRSSVSIVIKRENKGFDFAAWAHAFKLYPALMNKESVILANDSTFGPFCSDRFIEMLNEMYALNSDMVGLTENDELGWHLQSYFLLLKQTTLESTAFRNFINNVHSFKYKEEVIFEYETKLTSEMVRHGLCCKALFKSADSVNPTYYRWRDLVDRGFPYVKISVFLGDAIRRGVVGWRATLRSLGYDTSAADRTIAENYTSGSPDKFLEFSCGFISHRNALYNLHQFLASGGNLIIKNCPDPKITIIIVSHNKAEYLLSLISDVSRNPHISDAEIIIVDNGSTDETLHLITHISGPKVIRYNSHSDTAGMLSDIRDTAKSSRFLLVRNAIYFDTSLIEIALSATEGNENGKCVTGSTSRIDTYATHAYPPRADTAIDYFDRPKCSIFEFVTDAPFDYVAIFDKIFLDSYLLSEKEGLDTINAASTSKEMYNKNESMIEIDSRIKFALL